MSTLARIAPGFRPFLHAAAISLGMIAPSASFGGINPLYPPATFGGGTTGLAFLAGTNEAASSTITPTSYTGSFVGDLPTIFTNTNFNGVAYSGYTIQQGVVTFNVGSLPVKISDASLSANFKLAATGGDGIAGGADPYTSVTITSRIYQLISTTLHFDTDPVVPGTDLAMSAVQNGNGLNIVDTVVGPISPNYILSPGNYYMLLQVKVEGSYPAFGPAFPNRGVTLEFGGNLTSSAYSGLNYTFNWQTVPTPGAIGLAGLCGFAALSRRRG